MSQLRTNSIVPVGGIPVGASGGGIIQVVQTVKTDTFTTSTTGGVDITGFSATITPRSTSSKILVIVSCVTQTNAGSMVGIGIFRGSTKIFDGAANGSRTTMTTAAYSYGGNVSFNNIVPSNFTGLDSPATTSAVTYKVQLFISSSSYPGYIGSPGDGTNNTYNFLTPSYITLYEVSG